MTATVHDRSHPADKKMSDAQAPRPNRRAFLHEVRVRAMATEFVAVFPEPTGSQLDAAVDGLHAVHEIEARLSVYRPDSDISRLNAAGGQAISVDSLTLETLEAADRIARQTGGAFDVTAGPLIDAWGFRNRQGRQPAPDVLQKARQLVDFRGIQVDRPLGRAKLARAGMQVNLGAIGKGYALDVMAQRLQAAGIRNFLIHGGHSTILARGHREAESAGEEAAADHAGWKVGLQHPRQPTQRLGGLRLRDEALSTSGPGKQFFHHRGRRYGHVLDPRTGWPAGDLESLSVVRPSAAEADALSTALFVMGSAAAQDFADAHHIDWIGIAQHERQSSVQFVFGGQGQTRLSEKVVQ